MVTGGGPARGLLSNVAVPVSATHTAAGGGICRGGICGGGIGGGGSGSVGGSSGSKCCCSCVGVEFWGADEPAAGGGSWHRSSRGCSATACGSGTAGRGRTSISISASLGLSASIASSIVSSSMPSLAANFCSADTFIACSSSREKLREGDTGEPGCCSRSCRSCCCDCD